ncbi:hypothetical protein U91I_02454 [alpha proteobacterium U9-1i]|nr:hypothetical protein U91I_02454 [alpha proteobacterium U9-1i]
MNAHSLAAGSPFERGDDRMEGETGDRTLEPSTHPPTYPHRPRRYRGLVVHVS